MAEPTERLESPANVAPSSQIAYQPLSLMAMAGFAIAIIYGLIVLVGFGSSILFGSPWTMSAWTLLLPLAGLVLSLVARARIRGSEGTLAGLSLANWGSVLSLVSGLVFVSYSVATYTVLRRGAEAFTNQWFERLKSGDLEGAFLLTLPPATRPAEGPGLRNDIEIRFNPPSEATGVGPFSQLQQSEAVRFIVQGGSQTKVELLGIRDWDFVQGGYQVNQKYRISTPETSFDLLVPVYRSKGREKDAQGREWVILLGGLKMEPGSPTTQGANLFQLQGQALGVANAWKDRLRDGQLEEAYLWTRSPDERAALENTYHRQARSLFASLPGSGACGSWLHVATRRASLFMVRELCMPGYQDFLAGSLVNSDPKDFWPEGEKRTTAFAEVKKLFQQPGSALAASLEPARVSLAPWKVDGGLLQIRRDYTIVLGNHFIVDAALVLECDAKAAERGQRVDWRIAGLELIRARDFPAPASNRGPPRPRP